MKTYLILIFLFNLINIYAQLATVNEFPKSYVSQEINELTSVWLSENEILTFYTNSTLDTIFSRRTMNSGQSWSQQKFEQINNIHPDQRGKIYLEALKGHNSRILLSWRGKIIYSDDNGLTWNHSIPPHQDFIARLTNFVLLDSGKILFSFYDIKKRFIISYDNGETWLLDNIVDLPGPPFPIGYFSVAALTDDSLLCVSSRNSRSGPIYLVTSTDGGESWTDTLRIMDVNVLTSPNLALVIDKHKNVSLFFDQSFETGYPDYTQQDVGVLKSNDFGISWRVEENFTKYLGNDFLDNVSVLDGKFLVTFNSARNSEVEQNFYGVSGESADMFTPPVLLKAEVTNADYETNEFIYQALIDDNEEVSNVYVELGGGAFIAEMFDDGMHNDSLANDNIFGNTFPILNPALPVPHYGLAYAIDVNKINLPLNNAGILADVNFTHLSLLAEFKMQDIHNNFRIISQTALVPVQNPGSQGKFEEGNFLFSGGFVLSGYSNGELWSNGVASAMLVNDFVAGRVGSDPSDPLNRIYIVNKKDPPFGYTWQNWINAVSLGAEFYDGDGDGIYNPVDKNWNGTWDVNEDMPLLLGNETVFCIYNDAVPINQRRWNTVDPQGIEIRQTIFAANISELENVVFIKYSILNTGLVTEVMDSVYFGVWEDADVGDYTSDIVGCDTLLNSSFYYKDRPDAVYGDNPPAFFTSFLQGPIVNTDNQSDTAKNNLGQLIGSEIESSAKNLEMTSHVFFIGGDPNLNDPSNAAEARNFLEGKMRTGIFPNPCSFAYCEVRGGVNCNQVDKHFWASGDPVTNFGWINRMNVDHRNLISTGPFKLEKDKPQDIIIAYVMGRGTDHFNSITVARENVQRAIQEYESNFTSMTYSAPPPTTPVTSYVLYQNYPNPFNPNTTIRYEIPQDGVVTMEVFDILGQKVKTLINEFQRADRYEVTFNSTELASGVYIYQLRINDFITSKKMLLIK
jgi:hypothetical protein